MISYSRESYFKGVVAKMPINEQQRTFSAGSNELFDVFLSYNINDKDVVKGIYYVLKNMGFKVYVDFMVDPQLDRRSVTKETAECIQSRLKHSKSLIYAQSSNAAMSKWMPWELGVVDGNTSKCFIMPVQKGYEIINSRQEYLLLYPVIGINTSSELRVNDSESSNYSRPLAECLR
jgi:hypothetical protein